MRIFIRRRLGLMVGMLCTLGGLDALHGQADLAVGPVTYASGQTTIVSATNSITTTGAVFVSSGANVTFQANTVIYLEPGFTATLGSSFHVVIGGATTPTYTLTVENGSGTASGLIAGTTKPIVAAPPPSGQSFASWALISGPGTFANTYAANTTFTIGNGSATVRAVYAIGNPDADADHDGVPDAYTIDSDGDLFPDMLETLAGSNPLDPNSIPVGGAQTYNYDKLRQLKNGPGRTYTPDEEGNIKH